MRGIGSEFSRLLGMLRNLAHGPNSGSRKRATFLFEMLDDILNNFAKLPIKGDWIVPVYPRDKVGTLSNVHLILIAPLHPLVVFVEIFHLLTISIARATWLSW